MSTKDVDIVGATAPGFLALPDGPIKGAVVVVHEIFGRSPEMERVCVRLAAAGYAALMPDLFGDRFKPICISRAMGQLKSGKGDYIDVIKNAGVVVAHAASIARERVGVIGFCLGGGFALAVGEAFAVTSTNYGALPKAEAMPRPGPTIACYGSRDQTTRKSIPIIKDRLQQAGVPHEVHVFEGAGHAFMADGDHPIAGALTRFILDVDPVRDSVLREEAWTKVLVFFDRHLAVT